MRLGRAARARVSSTNLRYGQIQIQIQIYYNRSPEAKNHKIYSKQKTLKYNTTDNRTMRYKHTVDYDVAHSSEWQQGRLC